MLMLDKLKQLAELGAGDYQHRNGSLLTHLQGTRTILTSWHASSTLLDAALYHAVYSTAGFTQQLVELSQRATIKAIIGEAAEELVYQYCACDRNIFFPRFTTQSPPKFANRFTGEAYFLSDNLLGQFCELMAANEVEIALANPNAIALYRQNLDQLFTSMQPYLSKYAIRHTQQIFAQ